MASMCKVSVIFSSVLFVFTAPCLDFKTNNPIASHEAALPSFQFMFYFIHLKLSNDAYNFHKILTRPAAIFRINIKLISLTSESSMWANI